MPGQVGVCVCVCVYGESSNWTKEATQQTTTPMCFWNKSMFFTVSFLRQFKNWQHVNRKLGFLIETPGKQGPTTCKNPVSVGLITSFNCNANLLDVQKVSKFTYYVLTKTSIPENRIAFWDNIADTDDYEDTDWEEIHKRNFKLSIDTRVRSFYFKVFHKGIAFYNFLFKLIEMIFLIVISVKKTFPESIIYIFCECEYVIPIGMNFSKLFMINMTLISSILNFNKYLAFFKIISSHIYFCV